MIRKTIKLFGAVFGAILALTLVTSFGYMMAFIPMSFFDPSPTASGIRDSWYDRNYDVVHWIVAGVIALGLISLIYTLCSMAEEADGDCSKSCPCPQHSWNQDSSATAAAVTAATTAAITTTIIS